MAATLENLKPWKPGQSGNPGGKTSEQKRAELRAAELAAEARLKMVEALSEYVATNPAAAMDQIKADPLRLIKDAMEHVHGTPVQTIEFEDVTEDATAFARRMAGLAAKSDEGGTGEDGAADEGGA